MTRKYAKIIQPDGINFLIQKTHYTKEQAQEYIDMLIKKSEDYILRKKLGYNVAPLKTLEQLNADLEIIKKFQIIEVEE